MLNISSIAKAEKNKLHTDSAFIVLARIVPPASTGVSEICIAHNNEDIVWQGKLWQAFPFGIGDSKTDNTGSEPSIEFKVSNVSRTLTYLLEQAGGGTGSKVYIYVVNTAEIKGENQHSAGLADPTFTRSSTAYDDSGSVVAANTPRMSGRGLLIEEGTTNLLPSTVQNAVVNSTTLNPVYFAITTGLVQGGTYTLHGYKRIFDDDVSVFPRVTLDLKYSDGTVKNVQQLIPAKDGNWYSFQLSLTADSTKTLTNVYGWICDFSGFTGLMHQECKLCQLEQKSYATSYTDGTRAAESFVIPAAALNTTQSTIEFDVYSNATVPVINTIFDTRVGTQTSLNYAIILQRSAAGVWNLFAGYGTGFETKSYTGSALTAKTKKHIAIRFGSDGKVALFLDRIKVATTDNTYSLTLGNIITFLSDYRSLQQLDGYISNLRISNIARTDAELTTDTTPAVDEHTTYYMPLTDNMNFTAQAELEEQYTVGKTSVDENWVTFTLGAGYSLRTRRPFYRYMKNSCPFKYKGTRCACTSSEATCRHTLADCRARGNSKRYGGFPGIDQKGLYLE